MWAGVVTLFPEMFAALTEYGVTGRAVKRGQLEVAFSNPREHAHDRHRTVDDRPFGGGPGMLMKVEPLLEAIESITARAPSTPRVIYLSPQGRPLTQKRVQELASLDSLVLLCGRYEGIDERIIEMCVDEEISLGDYVLSGGELGAMVLLDSVTRLIPMRIQRLRIHFRKGGWIVRITPGRKRLQSGAYRRCCSVVTMN